MINTNHKSKVKFTLHPVSHASINRTVESDWLKVKTV